jgi:hypothetical protein
MCIGCHDLIKKYRFKIFLIQEFFASSEVLKLKKKDERPPPNPI